MCECFDAWWSLNGLWYYGIEECVAKKDMMEEQRYIEGAAYCTSSGLNSYLSVSRGREVTDEGSRVGANVFGSV